MLLSKIRSGSVARFLLTRKSLPSSRANRLSGAAILGTTCIILHTKQRSYCDSSALAHKESFAGSSLTSLALFEGSREEKEEKKEEAISVSALSPFYWLNGLSWLLSLAFRSCELAWIYFPAVLVSLPLLVYRDNERFERWLNTLRYCISQSGPCHIKFAQWIATRPDLFPQQLCVSFSDLQSSVSYKVSLEELQRVMQIEFGDDWREIIQLETVCVVGGSSEGWEEHPVVLGGGCVAQVYKGKAMIRTTTKTNKDSNDDNNQDNSHRNRHDNNHDNSHHDKTFSDWREIAIKVTHPNVKQQIIIDLDLMRAGASALEYLLPSLKNVSLLDSLEEFVPIMIQQVNMQHEAVNLLHFRENFQNIDEHTAIEEKRDFVANYHRRNSNSARRQLLYKGFREIDFKDENKERAGERRGEGGSGNESAVMRWLKAAVVDLMAHKWLNQIFEKYLLKATPDKPDLYSVYFPEPILPLTTENVLVETFEAGILMRDYLSSERCNEEETKNIARFGLNAVLKMVFLDNFVHADLHPGNIIVTQSSPDNPFRLCFIDTGIVGTLSLRDQANLIDLFDAVIKNQGYRVGQFMIERSRSPGSISAQNRQRFSLEMEELVARVHKTGLKSSKIDINDLLSSVLRLCFDYQVKLESRYAIIILAMGIVEGLGRQVDPDIDLIMSAAPFVLKASIQQLTKKE